MNVVGRIVRTCASEGWMEVEIDRPSCSSCAKAHGCGLGKGTGQQRSAPIRLALMANVEEGKPVSLQVPDKQLLQGVLFAYVLPLLLGLTGAMVAEPLLRLFGGVWVDDMVSAVAPAGFVVGLALGIVNLWHSGRKGVFGGIRACMATSADEPM